MIAICEDGTTIPCESYKSIGDGIVLFEDDDQDDVVGFVPHEELTYVLPDEVYDTPEQAERIAARVEAATRPNGDDPDERPAVESEGDGPVEANQEEPGRLETSGGRETRRDQSDDVSVTYEYFGVPWLTVTERTR